MLKQGHATDWTFAILNLYFSSSWGLFSEEYYKVMHFALKEDSLLDVVSKLLIDVPINSSFDCSMVSEQKKRVY